MKILNLTQHNATPEQKKAGVVDLDEKERELVKMLLTFERIPFGVTMRERAETLARLIVDKGFSMAMIGGAPFFMAPLEKALKDAGVEPLYAFSKREATEETQADGSMKKTQVFRHIGFVRT